MLHVHLPGGGLQHMVVGHGHELRLSAAVSVNGSVKNIQSRFTEKTPAAGHAKTLCIVADGFPHWIYSARTTETQNCCARAPSSFSQPSPTATGSAPPASRSCSAMASSSPGRGWKEGHVGHELELEAEKGPPLRAGPPRRRWNAAPRSRSPASRYVSVINDNHYCD